MSNIDAKTVMNVAKLARLKIDASEAEKQAKELSSLFNWIEQLSEVDTSHINLDNTGLPPLRLRDDVVSDGGITEEVLANAPQKMLDCFVVPKVVE
jgi:aspartyl-tRNA(Asn)/glutamyl-tRNA(Gln) amidotransferase subunit C